MKDRASYFRVGLFVIGGIFAAGLLVVLLAGQGLFASQETFETYFDESVQGLDIGSAVKLRGVPLGRVSTIGLVGDYYDLPPELKARDGQKIVVRMEIGADTGGSQRSRLLEKLIREGLHLRLSRSALTGIAYIEAEVEPAGREPPMQVAWTPDYPYIPSLPSTFKEFSTAAEQILERLSEMNVARVLTDLDLLLVAVRERVTALDVEGSQSQVRQLLSELRETNVRFQRVMASDDLAAFGAGAREAVERLNTALDGIQGMVEGGRYDLGVTLENLRIASENVRDLTETARAYPSLMILGDPPEPSPVPAP